MAGVYGLGDDAMMADCGLVDRNLANDGPRNLGVDPWSPEENAARAELAHRRDIERRLIAIERSIAAIERALADQWDGPPRGAE